MPSYWRCFIWCFFCIYWMPNDWLEPRSSEVLRSSYPLCDLPLKNMPLTGPDSEFQRSSLRFSNQNSWSKSSSWKLDPKRFTKSKSSAQNCICFNKLPVCAKGGRGNTKRFQSERKSSKKNRLICYSHCETEKKISAWSWDSDELQIKEIKIGIEEMNWRGTLNQRKHGKVLQSH